MSYDVGIIGAGVMGSNLALNIAEKGFKVALHNRTHSKTVDFIAAQPDKLKNNLGGFEGAEEFAAALKVPRKVLILVPAGKATDLVIEQMQKVLSKNDIIVDTGNAHFREQDARGKKLEEAGLRFLAMGISGGEEGARKGPAFFPGGSLSVWDDIKPIVEAAAAKAHDGRPCVTMNGRGGAGTCVKMYHNAGEYAILQIWGEVYDILKTSGASNAEIAKILEEWKTRGFLESYMLQISIEACKAKDEDGKDLTEKVLDRIGSKGTGLWSAQEALEAGVPAPSLNAAVISRQLTMFKSERAANAARGIVIAARPAALSSDDVEGLYHATCISLIACYAQMFQCLRVLDANFNFGINLPATIATFRAGCILQGYLLKPMTEAFEKDPDLPNLMCAFKKEITEGIESFRKIIGKVVATSSVSLPVFTASLTYVNAMFEETLKYAQLVSLQRDVFGRHGFERVDREGRFSHDWPELQ